MDRVPLLFATLVARQLPGFGLPTVNTATTTAGAAAGTTTTAAGSTAAIPNITNLYPALYYNDGKWTAAKITAIAVPLVLVTGVFIAFFILSFRRRRVVNAERKLTDELWAQRGGSDSKKAGDKTRTSTDSLVAYVEEKPPRPHFMRDSGALSSVGFTSRDSVASFASSMDSTVDDSRYRPASMIKSPSHSETSTKINPFEDTSSTRDSTHSLRHLTPPSDELSPTESPTSATRAASEDTSEEAELLYMLNTRRHHE